MELLFREEERGRGDQSMGLKHLSQCRLENAICLNKSAERHYGDFDHFFMKKLPWHIWPPKPFRIVPKGKIWCS